MEWILFGVVIIWLAIISWFDIRNKQIPHCAWVIIPLVLACVYRLWLGDWELVLLTVLVSLASERKWIYGQIQIDRIAHLNFWVPIIVLGSLIAVPHLPLASLAIVGFWLAWELNWWGGADATCAIALFLIWPDIYLMVAFIASHLIVILARKLIHYGDNSHWNQLPGLPILLTSVLIYLPEKMNIIHWGG